MTTREQAVLIASLPRAALIDRIEMLLQLVHLAGKYKPISSVLPDVKP